MQSEHNTPVSMLPWMTSDFVMNDGNLVIEDSENCIVALVTPAFENGVSLQLANAEFIVRACNAYADLVKGVQDAIEYLQHPGGEHLPAGTWFKLNEDLRATLAKAAGQDQP